MGYLKSRASEICQGIIDELCLPKDQWTHGATEITPKDNTDNERAFIFKYLVIKIAWPEKKIVKVGGQMKSVITE